MPEFFNRPPRIQPELPAGEYQIPTPPQDEGGRQNLIQLGLPIVTILGYLLVGRGGNPLFMLPMALSVLSTAAIGIMEYFKQRRLSRERDQAYLEQLADLRRDMVDSHDKQRIFYTHNYPDPTVSIQFAGMVDNPKPNPRLWERRTTDPDFGAVRIGMGTRPSSIIYKLQNSQAIDSILMKEAYKLDSDSRLVIDIPITVPLRSPYETEKKEKKEGEDKAAAPAAPSGRHAVGLAGSDFAKVADALRAAIVGLAATHSPTDVRVYVFGSEDTRSRWQWAGWLPHCNNSRNETSSGDQLGFDARRRRRLWDELQTELERRQLRMADHADYSITLPFLLVVIDAMTYTLEESALKEAETEAALSIILNSGPTLGAAIIFAVPDKNEVPSDCLAVIEVNSTDRAVAFRYAEVGVNTLRFDGVADNLDSKRAEDFARRLAPMAVRSIGGADLANAVSLLELNGWHSVEEIPLLTYWEQSRDPRNADWLHVPVGLMVGNKVRELVFAADGDGVHGMAAGTTGSGKSELLLTIITGLAVRYDPSIVNFVMVDFKGGAAFEPFRTLPHCVDIVTNLQGTAGARTFVALRSELNRRSKMIADTTTKHIVHYRSKNLHQTREPYPHLFVIIDEFAEMVKEMPEFKGHLDSISRLGRALGVHLLLATQRPAGVVSDQMRANMKFRICLRVETPEDSRELLRRSDAAFLPPNIPGRAYLQVGNENVELMQVARAGGPYTGVMQDTSPAVIWPNRERSADQPGSRPATEAPALSDVIVEICRRAADEHDEVKPQKKPWPDPLPTRLSLDSEFLYGERNPLVPLSPAVVEWLDGEASWHGVDWMENAMKVNVGLIDNPIRAEQLILTLDLTKGHAVIFGASGWGKTTFIRTVITGLAATHSPSELNVYLMDFGGRGLDVLTDMPHVVASVLPSEEERVTRLLRRINNELEQRREKLSQARADNILIYNTNNPDKVLPAILIVIDNFAEFRENFESYMDALIALVRDGRAYGIHFLVSAQLTNTLPGKLYNMFTERLTLRLADAGEYVNVVGRGVPDMGEIAGRGFVAINRTPLEFQVALPVGITAEEEEQGLDDTKKLAQLALYMKSAWKGERVPGIDILRSVIPLRNILPAQAGSRVHTIVGVEDQNLGPAAIDLANGPHFIVVGPPLVGKTTALRSFVMSMAHMFSPQQVTMILVDLQQKMFKYGNKAQHTLGDLPHVYMTVSDGKEFETMVARLKYEFENKRDESMPERPEIYVIVDNYDDLSSVISTSTAGGKVSAYKELGDLGRRYGQEGLHYVLCGSMNMMRAGEEFMKQAIASRFGLGLDASESPAALGGRIRGGGAEFPPGRGYIVRSGRLQLVQVAIPYEEGNLEESLDRWVDDIIQKYPEKAKLLYDLKPPEAGSEATEVDAATSAAPASLFASGASTAARPTAPTFGPRPRPSSTSSSTPSAPTTEADTPKENS